MTQARPYLNPGDYVSACIYIGERNFIMVLFTDIYWSSKFYANKMEWNEMKLNDKLTDSIYLPDRHVRLQN